MSNVDIEQTKNLVQRYFEALINRKDLSICDEMLAPSYVDHADSYPPAPEGTPPGPESIKEYVSGFLDDHPDMHTTVEEVIAEGDKAAARLIWRGTNRHSGAPFRQMGLVMLHLDEEGRFVERWSA
jgi:ketosteroid isomerase-like protein